MAVFDFHTFVLPEKSVSLCHWCTSNAFRELCTYENFCKNTRSQLLKTSVQPKTFNSCAFLDFIKQTDLVVLKEKHNVVFSKEVYACIYMGTYI